MGGGGGTCFFSPKINPLYLYLILAHFQGGTFYYMDIEMSMIGEDDRFGFSVMGGQDEGFQPRIDEVGPGRWTLLLD